MNAGQVTNNIFSFYLYDDDSGVLTLGGTNDDHHSTDLQWSVASPFVYTSLFRLKYEVI